jgi:IS30 family transposase
MVQYFVQFDIHQPLDMSRNGVVVGFVAPLDRLVVRQISSRYLSQDERIEIADLGQSGLIVRAIAGQLGRAPSTISRELRRNAVTGRGYRPFDAHRRDTVRRARRHRRRIDINSELSGVVAELLVQRWSPQQISRHLRLRFVDDPSMWLSHESIHQAVYQPNSRFLQPSRLAPHRRSPLRTGRDHRRAQQRRRPSLSSQCSPSTTGRSRLTTDPRPGMGRAI